MRLSVSLLQKSVIVTGTSSSSRQTGVPRAAGKPDFSFGSKLVIFSISWIVLSYGLSLEIKFYYI